MWSATCFARNVIWSVITLGRMDRITQEKENREPRIGWKGSDQIILGCSSYWIWWRWRWCLGWWRKKHIVYSIKRRRIMASAKVATEVECEEEARMTGRTHKSSSKNFDFLNLFFPQVFWFSVSSGNEKGIISTNLPSHHHRAIHDHDPTPHSTAFFPASVPYFWGV